MSLFTRLLASALRGILFFGAFDFALAGVRSRVACFFAALILLEPLVVTLDALRAGTFAAVERFIIDLGRADLALMARPFDDVLAVDRRDAARLIPFVIGLLIVIFDSKAQILRALPRNLGAA